MLKRGAVRISMLATLLVVAMGVSDAPTTGRETAQVSWWTPTPAR